MSLSSIYIDLPAFGNAHWKAPVLTAFDLPANGNQISDVRQVIDTEELYTWEGAQWGILPGGGAKPFYTKSIVNNGGIVTLVNDSLAPGNLKYYGTDGSGVKGFFSGTVFTTVSPPLVDTNGLISIPQASTSVSGFLSSSDFNTFNNKLDASRSNYISNSDAETDTTGWNIYDNSSRSTPASVIAQAITYTAVASGNAGNGVNVNYIFHASQSYLNPLVTVVSPTLITVAWYNGPTVSNNPTATQLKAAFDAVPAAVAIATAAITGTASSLQYITGSNIMIGGGASSPIDGAGSTGAGVTFTIDTAIPLVGNASFSLNKDAANRQGQGVSTDFIIDTLDKGNALQISFAYDGLAGIVLGTSSDVQVFIYDINNAVLIPVTPLRTLVGPANAPKTFVGQFQTNSTSVDYRLILHIATQNTAAWNLLLDNVIVNSVLNAAAVTQVESVVLQSQPVSGSVTDHMAVMWTDGATAWIPATSTFGSDPLNMIGFATNIVAGTADIYVSGYMDGFSFGPFAGYNQFVDPANPGMLTPLPSPYTDTYLIMGKGISATAINIQVTKGQDLITTKGGLLTNAGANNGTGDQVLAVGGNGNVLAANSGAAVGLSWQPAVVAAAPFTYTTATRTLTVATATNAVAGVMSAADHALLHNPVTIGTANGLSLSTQVLSLAAATNAVPGALTAADHTTYSGYAATIALKAPIAAPAFTGDVNSSTGNVLISTIGKGVQIKTGANSKMGTAVLVAGTATVANTSVTANSLVFLTSQVNGGTPGFLRVTAKTAATSFVITSSSATDTSTVAWLIMETL